MRHDPTPPAGDSGDGEAARDPRLQVLLDGDPYLKPYADIITRRMARVDRQADRITGGTRTLREFAGGHYFFGLHPADDGWILREWAPNADRIFVVGEMTQWEEREAFALKRITQDGAWEIRLPLGAVSHGDLYRLRVHWPGGCGDRIPAWARRVVQDPDTFIFNAQVWAPDRPYSWRCPEFHPPQAPLLIYEAHVGMALEEEKVGTFQEFSAQVLPRIAAAGYNTLQLMAIQEHPYYGSFGYQVSSFFAPSSRFGTPDDLKSLVDSAHEKGLAVIMDLVHSHAVNNEVEGISRFDGTLYQYFHAGPRGVHTAWNSRCFDYGKPEVLHFLLSNCRFWLEEYRFDGFRFDGVTSMLYRDHGLNRHFGGYGDYFNDQVDEDALAYMALANRLVHDIRADAVTIAEEVSGMPALAVPVEKGGMGFDYRFAMGVPDYWIRLTKDVPDEKWSMGHLWHELTNRRSEENTISYAESHDQALVGDQTLIFRLIGGDMFDHMRVADDRLSVDRGTALHKMIRLITLATADKGYLNFMGNEFGHPEWIDFPREENGWSFWHARRQWHLADDPLLKYRGLARFDRAMIDLACRSALLQDSYLRLLHEHSEEKTIAFLRAGRVFVFNFHPHRSHAGYTIQAPAGEYRIVLDSDAPVYGGHGRIDPTRHHFTTRDDSGAADRLSLYIPSRTSLVLEPVEGEF